MRTSHLTELLRSTIHYKNISRKQIIEACGGTNPTKSYRRLDDLMEGRGYTEEDNQGTFFLKVTAFLGLPIEEIRRAKARDREEDLAEKKRTFEPIIFVETEHIPTQITFFGFMNGMKKWRIICLPDRIDDFSQGQQFDIVGHAIRSHYEAQDGQVRFCGKITRYRYCQTYDTSYTFDKDGEFSGGPFPRFSPPVMTVTLC